MNPVDSFIISSIIKKNTSKNIHPIVKQNLTKLPFIGSFSPAFIVINNYLEKNIEIIKKIASINKLEESSKENFEMVNSFIIKNYEFFIPLEGGFDKDAEIMKLKKELDYNEGFLKSVENKLKNENFVKNAPAAIVNIEKQKILDTRSKIKSIQKSISELS